jgi:YHS domain-containing protein/multidrug efflux pump subunit AcrA (membrane-fusion protein)
MNPAHTSDQPGIAPCGMSMEPVYAEASLPGSIPPGTVRISPDKQQMLGVRVEKVGRTANHHVLRTLGRVAADENLTHRVTAGANGWVWDVHQATTGSLVKKDQLMATVYNYQFLTRQQQFLYALEFEERRKKVAAKKAMQTNSGHQRKKGSSGDTHQQHQTRQPGRQPFAAQLSSWSKVPTTPGGLNSAGGMVYTIRDQLEVARLELYSLGVSEYQIQEIARARRIALDIEVRSPVDGLVLARNVSPQQRFDKGAELFRIADLSRVWILADIFEQEADYIRPGDKARVFLPRHGHGFEAIVTEVPPSFDPVTRTLKVRLEADNPQLALRPDMFVDVEFIIHFPEALTVPASAVLDSGMRKAVFVDKGNGFFEPRAVETGWRFGGRVEILKGLMPDERIAVSGNFLLDSESRMNLAATGFYEIPEKDIICGMDAYPGKAKRAGLTSDFEGKTYYFCSEQCKAQFDHEHTLHTATPAEGRRPSHTTALNKKLSMTGSWKDPVCGMLVQVNKAEADGLKSAYQGNTYYFCAESCKKRFEENAKFFVAKIAGNMGQPGVPDHAERQHDKPRN